MKRRGFLALIGLAGGAAAAGSALAAQNDNDEARGVWLPIGCGKCGTHTKIFADLTEVLALPRPQCPRCLDVLAYPESSSQLIKQWNIKHGFKTTIYTPMERV